MIEGHIEAVLPEGIVVGWVRDTQDPVPCQLRLRHAGRVVADARASLFRADLLRGGHGHGHHGFRARLTTPLPTGACSIAVTLMRQGQTVPMAVVVPELRPARACRVERLLRAAPGWTAGDVLARPECLKLEANRQTMGTPRFVDCLFRFALERWPSEAESQVHARDLDHGRIGAQALLTELLSSRERADMKGALVGPLDPAFPFALV